MSITDKNNTSKIENKPIAYAIGDWVRCGVKKDKIVALTKGKAYLEKNGGVGLYRVNPLPICLDVLWKNGFKSEDEKWWELINEGDGFVIKADISNGQTMIIYNSRTKTSLIGHIEYVHELQQLLRVMRIDLEIDLK